MRGKAGVPPAELRVSRSSANAESRSCVIGLEDLPNDECVLWPRTEGPHTFSQIQSDRSWERNSATRAIRPTLHPSPASLSAPPPTATQSPAAHSPPSSPPSRSATAASSAPPPSPPAT